MSPLRWHCSELCTITFEQIELMKQNGVFDIPSKKYNSN